MGFLNIGSKVLSIWRKNDCNWIPMPDAAVLCLCLGGYKWLTFHEIFRVELRKLLAAILSIWKTERERKCNHFLNYDRKNCSYCQSWWHGAVFSEIKENLPKLKKVEKNYKWIFCSTKHFLIINMNFPSKVEKFTRGWRLCKFWQWQIQSFNCCRAARHLYLRLWNKQWGKYSRGW